MANHTMSKNALFENPPHTGRARIARKTLDKIDELLSASGVNLVYAGYPYDPFTSDAPKH